VLAISTARAVSFGARIVEELRTTAPRLKISSRACLCSNTFNLLYRRPAVGRPSVLLNAPELAEAGRLQIRDKA
jgi:hypothetical protein